MEGVEGKAGGRDPGSSDLSVAKLWTRKPGRLVFASHADPGASRSGGGQRGLGRAWAGRRGWPPWREQLQAVTNEPATTGNSAGVSIACTHENGHRQGEEVDPAGRKKR